MLSENGGARTWGRQAEERRFESSLVPQGGTRPCTLMVEADPTLWMTSADTRPTSRCLPFFPYRLWAALICHQRARVRGTAAAAAAASAMTPKPRLE
jgi:hypothetical protein